MPLGNGYGREAGGSPIDMEVLGMKIVVQWFDDSRLRKL